ncbi:MAG: hypothetical protein ACYS1C_08000 [Planctomycetota bacterium]|jgi:hypothetical protein
MAARALKYVLVFGVTAFFAVMWGLLLRAHLPSPAAEPVRPDYGNLLKPGQQERTTRWAIYFGEFRIGDSEMSIERLEDGTISIHTRSEVNLEGAAEFLLGTSGVVDVDFRVNVSPLRGPLFFQVGSEKLKTTLHGRIRAGEILLTGHVSGRKVRTTLPFDQDRLLGEAFSPLAAMPELAKSRVGGTWKVDMVDPIAGRLQQTTVTILSSKEVELAGQAVTLFELHFAMGRNRWTSWVTEDGEVLVQGTPFGLTLRREDLSAALAEQLGTEPLTPVMDGT